MIYCVEREQRSVANNQKHISRENDMVFRTHMESNFISAAINFSFKMLLQNVFERVEPI